MKKQNSPNSNYYDSQMDDGWARIETHREACFSRNQTAIEFHLDGADKTLVKFCAGESKKELSIAKSEAEAFLRKIIELGEKPEVSSESRQTTSYKTEVEWRNLTFFKNAVSGEIRAFSNEWTTEELEEFALNFKDEKIAEKLRGLLEKGLHRRAIEIYLETEKFVKRHFSPLEKV